LIHSLPAYPRSLLAGGMLLPAGALSAPVDDMAFSRVAEACTDLQLPHI
jgi:hypothetical protein